MTAEELDLIRQAVDLLHRLVAPGGNGIPKPVTHQSPVIRFVERYIRRDAQDDLTCAELWRFYSEIAVVDELEAVSRSEFFRLLPATMEKTFGVKKCHGILRDGVRLRGFRSVTLREDTG
jgi:hypothetical protein